MFLVILDEIKEEASWL